jgi:hypothetical protein
VERSESAVVAAKRTTIGAEWRLELAVDVGTRVPLGRAACHSTGRRASASVIVELVFRDIASAMRYIIVMSRDSTAFAC